MRLPKLKLISDMWLVVLSSPRHIANVMLAAGVFQVILIFIKKHPRSSKFITQHSKAICKESLFHLHKNLSITGK